MTVQLRKFWWSSMDCRIKHTSSQSLTWPDLYIFPSTRCWGWNLNTLATWCKGLTHWKRPWCWERLKAAREGDNRGWDGWLASLTRWTWVRASGLGDGQGSPVCCSPWGRKKLARGEGELVITLESWEATRDQIMNSLLPNSDLNWRK